MVAPVAQLDRASASGVEGHEFESRRVYQFFLSFFRGFEPKTQVPLFFLPFLRLTTANTLYKAVHLSTLRSPA